MITSKAGVSLQARASKWKAAWMRTPRKPKDDRILRILADGAEICQDIYTFAGEGPKNDKRHHGEVRDLLSLWLDVAHLMEPLLTRAADAVRSDPVTRTFARQVTKSRTTMLLLPTAHGRPSGGRAAPARRNRTEVVGNARKLRRTVGR